MVDSFEITSQLWMEYRNACHSKSVLRAVGENAEIVSCKVVLRPGSVLFVCLVFRFVVPRIQPKEGLGVNPRRQ